MMDLDATSNSAAQVDVHWSVMMRCGVRRLPITVAASILCAWLILVSGGGCASAARRNGIGPATQPAARIEWHSRRAFAEQFAKIGEWMPADQVEAILGQPDDVRTQRDPGRIDLTNTREIWGYGTDRHLGFATLASIAIDSERRVQYLSGTAGGGELDAQLGEDELRRLLRLLNEAGGRHLTGEKYNPRPVIAAVNALQPLGKSLGIAVLREYLKVSLGSGLGEDAGLYAVIRALFDLPSVSSAPVQAQPVFDYFAIIRTGYLRPPLLGRADWEPEDLSQFPRFPLVLVDDVPLVVVTGYTLLEQPEAVSHHLDLLERDAQWRSQPLRPTDDPLKTLDKLNSILPRDHRRGPNFDSMIERQLLQLVSTVHRDANARFIDPDFPTDEAGIFQAAVPEVRSMNIRWDANQSCYARADGTTLPPEIMPIYHREVFSPSLGGDLRVEISVVLERRSLSFVHEQIEVFEKSGWAPSMKFRLIELSQPPRILSEDTINAGNGTQSWSSRNSSFRVEGGEKLQIEMIQGGRHYVSPVFQP
jgi:hypothetical protein